MTLPARERRRHSLLRGALVRERWGGSDIAVGSDITLELPTAVVAAWVSRPSTNHGLAMFVDGNEFYCEVGSTEAGASVQRPVLELSLQ